MINTNIKIIVALLFFNTAIFSQEFQGKATYQTKTIIEFNLEGSQISIEQQKMIEERMKKGMEKVFELSFNKTASLYKEEEKLEQPGQKGNVRFMGGFGAGKYYKNTKTKSYVKEQNLMGKEFLVKDSLKTLDWTLEKESKLIGTHFCLKATAKKLVPNRENIRFGRGKRKDENSDKPKDSLREIEIIAWYTPEIPVSHGPNDYWGLPGLILEVNADKTQIVCTKIVINPKEKTEIKAPKKGTVVTEEEFKEITIKKMKEMSEMYGRGRKGNKGINIRIGG